VKRIDATKLAAAAARGALTLALLSALLLAAARPAQTQTETVLYNFFPPGGYGDDGAYPYAGLTSDGAGNLYGTTHSGGSCGESCQPPNPAGTVFELSPNGYGGWNETILYSFCSAPNCADGSGPFYANLIFDSAGNLYGTAAYGGANGAGVLFKLSPAGAGWEETVLYNFCSQSGCTDGAYPVTGPIFDQAGNLYGTTGGAGQGPAVVFELSPSAGGWTEQAIYSIPTGNSWAGLVMDAAGNIYGTSATNEFELSPNGSGGWTPTVIGTLGGAEGTPVLDKAGNLYGTTNSGGADNCGVVYKLTPAINGKWSEKILHTFKNYGIDGCSPFGGIVLDAAGDIYGTTYFGGSFGAGTVFEVATPVGAGSHKTSVLWSFNGTDGESPLGSLILDSAGNLYGTADEGGSTNGEGVDGNGFGVVFELSQVPHKIATATTLVSSPNPSSVGQAATFTAGVSSTAGTPPNGETVSFMKGTKILGKGALSGGSASFTTSTLKVGTDPITAVYGGDSNFGGSTSNAVSQVVNRASTTTTLASSLNPSNSGQSVPFTATVAGQFGGKVTGSVTFLDGTTPLKTVSLSGGEAEYTTSKLTEGTHTITATYNGSKDFTASSASLTQTVN
jgi:uncharacterized repeat protein (TIGR03803 family)